MDGTCCGCGAGTAEVADFGTHRLPDFINPGSPLPPEYPLRLMLCPDCTLLQLDDLAPRGEIYHERYGFKSGINEAVRADLADVAAYALRFVPEPSRWLDIACNDGTLLSNVPTRVQRTGTDPLVQFAPEARKHADRIVSDYFRPDNFERGEFDVITAVSMFYDLADPVEFARGVEQVLAADGIWVIQQNYAGSMVRLNALDNVCSEHVTYFTVRSLRRVLKQAGLEIKDVTYSDVNGGCFRVAAGRRGRLAMPSIDTALDWERSMALDRVVRYRRWAAEVRCELDKTREFVAKRTTAGNSAYLYGASTRGGVLLKLAGIGPELLPYAVERNPAKVGKIMAATEIPIISEERMRAAEPDFLLVSPWFFRDVFVKRERDYLESGGRMIFPLPYFEVT